MQNLKSLIVIVFLVAIATTLSAQDESSEPTSSISWFYSACEDRMVIDLNGTIQTGYDVYFQAFDGFGGTGNALTGLRQVSVDGDYSVSQVVTWLNDETRILGTPISVVIRMGRESDPEDTIFNEPSDDFLAECAEPASTLTDSNDLTSGIFNEGELIRSSGIRTPDGGVLNPVYYRAPEPIVQIGARFSEANFVDRTENPGLIYAQCSDVAGADPGVIFDTDEIVVFWSWYAKTAEQVENHIANSMYYVTIDEQPIPEVRVSPIQKIPNDNNYWVFYTANLGSKWRPGVYGLNYNLRWINTITDGYADFGPGTTNDFFDSGCYFEIIQNPHDIEVLYEQPALPLKTYNYLDD